VSPPPALPLRKETASTLPRGAVHVISVRQKVPETNTSSGDTNVCCFRNPDCPSDRGIGIAEMTIAEAVASCRKPVCVLVAHKADARECQRLSCRDDHFAR
jgi:hypothetical protein